MRTSQQFAYFWLCLAFVAFGSAAFGGVVNSNNFSSDYSVVRVWESQPTTPAAVRCHDGSIPDENHIICRPRSRLNSQSRAVSTPLIGRSVSPERSERLDQFAEVRLRDVARESWLLGPTPFRAIFRVTSRFLS